MKKRVCPRREKSKREQRCQCQHMVGLMSGQHTPVKARMVMRDDEQMLPTRDETKQLLVRVERVGRIIPQANFWLW